MKVGPYDRIWKSDALIPESLRLELLDAVALLEYVPDDQKDWHPGTRGQVLDLVHPSLYPVVYNRTIGISGNVLQAPQLGHDGETAEFYSERFQWMPSDFAFEADRRTVKLESPYINNIHPSDHRKLHGLIPRLVEWAVLMFDRVLSDLRRTHELPYRVGSDGDFTSAPDCLWPEDYAESDDGDDSDDDDGSSGEGSNEVSHNFAFLWL
jgi:hypothetical protein